ncbi:MAG: response regulator, partial [Mycoplasmataceae bacterium]|nr:response regulator [Mycoplasmataceae bacterium]
LMDIQMPVMDGYEATEIIRKTFDNESLPIIAMTAHALVGEKEKSLCNGMNDHITKPIVPDILFSTIAKWVKTTNDKKIDNKENTQKSNPKPMQKQNVLAELPRIDLQQALMNVDGNHTLLIELLKKFYQTYQTTANDIVHALNTDNQEFISNRLHSIKGLAGTLGAMTLSKVANTLEAKILRGEDHIQALGLFITEINAVMTGLASLDTTIPATITPPPQTILTHYDNGLDAELIIIKIQELRQLLTSGSSQASDALQILKYLLNKQVLPITDNLSELIKNYEFDDAIHALEQLELELQSILK